MSHNITDLHMHILPDVDDGSADLDTSMSMLAESVACGVTNIFATPHCFSYLSEKSIIEAREAFRTLDFAIKEQNLPLKLHQGCEILCMERWMDRVIRYLDDGIFPSMNQTSYILIEFPSWEITEEEVRDCVDRLMSHGWIPIFAHIERYAQLFASVPFIESMKKKGCLFQINLFNLFDAKYPEIGDFCQEIIRLELVDFIGSDAHNIHHRSPRYEQGLSYLRANCREEYLERILHGNVEQFLLKRS